MQGIAASLGTQLRVETRGQLAGEDHGIIQAAAESEGLVADWKPLPGQSTLQPDNGGFHRISSRFRRSAVCLTVTEHS